MTKDQKIADLEKTVRQLKKELKKWDEIRIIIQGIKDSIPGVKHEDK